MFNNRTWFKYSSDNIVEQKYTVLFTNASQVGKQLDQATIGSMIISPKSDYFSNRGKFYLGSFINSSIFNNNFVNIGYSKTSRKYPFIAVATEDAVNPVQADDVVTSADGADKNLYDTYVCKNTELGQLFRITILKTITAQPYSITINPATVQIYEAIDSNDNGEIDTQDLFGLGDAFSELLYTLTPVSNDAKVNVPKVIDSWVLDRDFHNIKGSALSINMNVKWNVGYNLGNFFTIRENNVAKFDVITVHTEYNSSVNDKNMTSLVVSPISSLIVRNKESWAHAAERNSALSGLAFKLNATKINASEIVRLFVDNQVPANNTLEFAVGNKSYKLSSYDQEQYASLLDEQIRFTNKLE
jgi:hypothetical protein